MELNADNPTGPKLSSSNAFTLVHFQPEMQAQHTVTDRSGRMVQHHNCNQPSSLPPAISLVICKQHARANVIVAAMLLLGCTDGWCEAGQLRCACEHAQDDAEWRVRPHTLTHQGLQQQQQHKQSESRLRR